MKFANLFIRRIAVMVATSVVVSAVALAVRADDAKQVYEKNCVSCHGPKEGGKAVGKSASMPAYGSKLSDEQIQGLAQYVKGLK